MPKKLTAHEKEQIIEATKSFPTMRQAANHLGVPYRTFIERAKKLDTYKPNQNEAGVRKCTNVHPIEDILAGKHPSYDTNRLRNRLINEHIFEYKCYECNLGPTWNKKPLTLQLDHINGNRYDHRKENLRFLCPNCHTQTHTWGRNNKSMWVTDQEIIECYNKVGSIKGVQVELGLSNSSTTHYRISNLVRGDVRELADRPE